MTVIVEVLPDPEAVARRAADAVAEIAPRTIALSGGSTPRATYALLGRRGALAASEVFFVDERCVPPDEAASNYRLVRETIGDAAAIHRVRGEDPPDEAARIYDEELRALLGDQPAFDLVVLGMGADGHTASLFPGAPELAERERAAVATRDARAGFRRVTLTLPVLNRARQALFVVTGADKAEAFSRVLGGETLPAARVLGARWLVDAAVAAAAPAALRRRSRDPGEGQESLFEI